MDGHKIEMDDKSVEWAHGLGKEYRSATLGYKGLRADRICPFREGSPHRVAWYGGWRDKPIPYQLAI